MAYAINSVNFTGRLGRDPEERYGSKSQLAIVRFPLALNRGTDSNGKDKGTDWPNIVVFGKPAEWIAKNMRKGDMISIAGRVSTSKYEKEGTTFYSTEFIADSFVPLKTSASKTDEDVPAGAPSAYDVTGDPNYGTQETIEGFEKVDIPF